MWAFDQQLPFWLEKLNIYLHEALALLLANQTNWPIGLVNLEQVFFKLFNSTKFDWAMQNVNRFGCLLLEFGL